MTKHCRISIPRRASAMLRHVALLQVVLQLVFPTLVLALPSNGQVAAGSATIQQVDQSTTQIDQSTDKAIINWQGFSIDGGQTVRFQQPNVNSITLNRVVGADPSVILGQLLANGRIFLINPNGILFGPGSRVNVGGLLASTLNISDQNFLSGRYQFTQDPSKALATIINQGTIQVSDHGVAMLIAPGVVNEGLIVANLGTVL